MIGERLGKWIIETEIGRGGMGCVYRAREAEPAEGAEPRRAAIKVLNPQLAQQMGLLERFSREIEALAKLRHPNIVEFYEAGEHQGRYYYAMEYIEGINYEDLLHERGPLPFEEVIDLGVQLCPALKLAHDHGIIHRDIKPPNLLRTRGGVVKLTDFGIAKVFSEERLTATNTVVGTAEYMSPEQASGKPVTRRSDLYSLGITFYVLITGRMPFQGTSALDMMHKHLYGRFDPPRRLVPDIPVELDALICQLLEKDPEKRPPDALVLGRQFERIQKRLTVRADATQVDDSTSATLMMPRETDGGGRLTKDPARLMAKLMRAELEQMNRPGPISRAMDRAWLLSLLLVVVIATLVWMLWPKSNADLLRDAQTFAAQEDWDRVEKRLDRIQPSDSDPVDAAAVADLRRQLEAARNRPRRPAGNSLAPPAGQGERFYREGLQEYVAGRAQAARQTWQRMVTAFAGVPSEQPWLELARQALEATQNGKEDLAAVEEAIRRARGETPDAGRQRLQALLELYSNARDPAAQAARAKVQQALADLQKN